MRVLVHVHVRLDVCMGFRFLYPALQLQSVGFLHSPLLERQLWLLSIVARAC